MENKHKLGNDSTEEQKCFPSRIICSVCEKYFKGMTFYPTHIMKYHSEHSKDLLKSKWFQCNSKFDDFMSMTMHYEYMHKAKLDKQA